jgi:hypothetical protein
MDHGGGVESEVAKGAKNEWGQNRPMLLEYILFIYEYNILVK